MVEVPDAVKPQKCLTTLMLRRSPRTKMIENELFERLRFLRIITINDTSLESLPNSIGDLLHLRYLDLDRTKIKKVPESIGCLILLQVLNLSGCESLHTLPKAITKLCNLRCLRLEGTPLTHVPKGIGKLKHLNYFRGFVIGHDDRRGAEDDEGCDLEELQSLSQLRFLEINRLDRREPRGAPVLANSNFLRTLILNCQHLLEDDAEALAIQRIDKIYNELSPQSTHLQNLQIRNFFGSGFPSWMMSPSLDRLHFPSLKSWNFAGWTTGKNGRLVWWRGVGEERRGAPKLLPYLSKLGLGGCPKLRSLPPLGLLPQLKSLCIVTAYAIKTIGPEFLGPRALSAATSFPKLEELQFYGLKNWEEWSFGMMEGVGEEKRGASKLLPRLTKLVLYQCPKLRALPDIKNLPSLKSLRIMNCPRLEHVENLDKLQFLEVRLSSSTETSTTDADGQTERLPQWLLELLQNAPTAMQSLKEFQLRCSLPVLKTFLKDGPNWPIIQPIPQVTIQEYLPANRRPSHIRYTKDPPTFKMHIEE
uniref:Disease resistance protein At3g14460 n=1 Tax=Elaeis guineensis var. tenera TaxID=51953 RepID=A0A6J0PPQ6_ELAGV|nr:putative disease resistance protein At3g14460 [Elaeis guineensis]